MEVYDLVLSDFSKAVVMADGYFWDGGYCHFFREYEKYLFWKTKTVIASYELPKEVAVRNPLVAHLLGESYG